MLEINKKPQVRIEENRWIQRYQSHITDAYYKANKVVVLNFRGSNFSLFPG